MLFSSVPFLVYFLPCVLLVYFLVPGTLKNGVLLLASLLFYGWGEPRYLLVMLAAIAQGYVFGLLIEKSRGKRRAGLYLALSVLLSLGTLAYFKYADFMIRNLNALTGLSVPLLSLALPVGISFYTFQILSYTVDVYRGTVPAQRNLIDLAAYIAMFPQLIAGPIVRYSDIAPELRSRTHTLSDAAAGTRRFVLGLAKKILFANLLGELVSGFRASQEQSVLYFWLGAAAFTLQIYYDFSGYSDMAIGIGEFFGITLPENFEYPYLACSVGEYWRRWHISLSSWFRDYVYIPLGGSRCRLRRTCLNLLIVFALTGLWHGAAWQYVVFGLLHGIILCMERLGLRRALEQLPRLFRHLYTVVLLWLTLVIFGAPGLSEGLAVLKGIFTWQSGAKGYTLAAFADTKLLLILAASFLLCGPVQALCPKLKAALYAKKAPSPAGMAGLLVLLFLGLMRVTAGTYSAFIYFQF